MFPSHSWIFAIWNDFSLSDLKKFTVIKLDDFEISPVNILKAIRSYLLGNGAYTKACSMKQD